MFYKWLLVILMKIALSPGFAEENQNILYVYPSDLKKAETEYLAYGSGLHNLTECLIEFENREDTDLTCMGVVPGRLATTKQEQFFDSSKNKKHDIFYLNDFDQLNKIENDYRPAYNYRTSVSYQNGFPKEGSSRHEDLRYTEDFEVIKAENFLYEIEHYGKEEGRREFVENYWTHTTLMGSKGTLFYQRDYFDDEKGGFYFNKPVKLTFNDKEFAPCANLNFRLFEGELEEGNLQKIKDHCKNFPSHKCFRNFFENNKDLSLEGPDPVELRTSSRSVSKKITNISSQGPLQRGESRLKNVPWNIGLEDFLDSGGKESFLFNNNGEPAKELVNRIYRNRVKEIMERDETCIPENVKDHIDQLEFPMPDYMVIDFGAGIFLVFEFFEK